VYADSSSSGNLRKAVNTSETSADAIGIVVESGGISASASGEIAIGPIVVNGGSWVTGGAIYVSATPGAITQTKPVTGFVKPLGFAVSTTQIFVNPQTGWNSANE
jgi:hypothetical protein